MSSAQHGVAGASQTPQTETWKISQSEQSSLTWAVWWQQFLVKVRRNDSRRHHSGGHVRRRQHNLRKLHPGPRGPNRKFNKQPEIFGHFRVVQSLLLLPVVLRGLSSLTLFILYTADRQIREKCEMILFPKRCVRVCAVELCWIACGHTLFCVFLSKKSLRGDVGQLQQFSWQENWGLMASTGLTRGAQVLSLASAHKRWKKEDQDRKNCVSHKFFLWFCYVEKYKCCNLFFS